MNKTQVSDLFKKLNDSRETLGAGWLAKDELDDQVQVYAVWNGKDLINNKTDTRITQYHVTKSTKAVGKSFPGPWNSKLQSISPSGKYLAVIGVDTKVEKLATKYTSTIRVYSKTKLVACFQTPEKLHGQIYTGIRDAALSWSKDETRLAFIAEKYVKDGEPLWKNVNDKDKEQGDEAERRGKYDLQQDWGEAYVGQKTGQVFVAYLETGKCVEIANVPHDTSCAEVCWAPNDQGLVFTGYDIKNPSRLGFVHCFNRKSSIYYVTATPKAEQSDEPSFVCLTPLDATARSPRFSPDGKVLAYLTTDEIVTHYTCSKLCTLPWNSNVSDEMGRSRTVLIDVVQEPASADSRIAADDFNGIFSHVLPVRCWSRDSKQIYLNTFVGSRLLWKTVSLADGVARSPPNGYIQEKVATEKLVDFLDGYVLVEVASPKQPSSLYLYLNDSGPAIPLEIRQDSSYIAKWYLEPISPSVKVEEPVVEKKTPIDLSLLTIIEKPESKSNYEAMLLLPSGKMPDQGWPVVVDIHGGPHSVTPAVYKILNDFYCALGFAIAIVNYRGSAGYGIRPLESLVGRAGFQDILDTQRAVEHFVNGKWTENGVMFDKSRIYCTGGSHGGFISTHLIGKFPNYYRASAVRNPVTNIASQVVTSDIPEWGCGVTGLSGVSFATFPNYQRPFPTDLSSNFDSRENTAQLAEAFKYLLSHSPMGNDLLKIRTPILFGLGAKDRRVPYTEGLQFQKALQALGVETKVLWYPEDNHPLSSVEAYGDYAVNGALWLLEH